MLRLKQQQTLCIILVWCACGVLLPCRAARRATAQTDRRTLPELNQKQQQQQQNIATICTAAELVAAVASPAVETALVLSDLVLTEADFVAWGPSITLQRNLTVKGAASRPVILNMNFVRAKIVLQGSATLLFENVFVANYRKGSAVQQPGFDIVTVTPPPGNGGGGPNGSNDNSISIPLVRIQDASLVFNYCFPVNLSREALSKFVRPVEIPGRNIYSVPLSHGAYFCQEGVTTGPWPLGGASTAPWPLDGCFLGGSAFNDTAFYAGDMNDDGTPHREGRKYIFHAVNTSVQCIDVLSDECLYMYGPLGCSLYTTSRKARRAPPPGADQQQQQWNDEENQVRVRRQSIIMGCALGVGLSLLLILVVIGGIHIQRRRRKRHQQRSTSKGAMIAGDSGGPSVGIALEVPTAVVAATRPAGTLPPAVSKDHAGCDKDAAASSCQQAATAAHHNAPWYSGALLCRLASATTEACCASQGMPRQHWRRQRQAGDLLGFDPNSQPQGSAGGGQRYLTMADSSPSPPADAGATGLASSPAAAAAASGGNWAPAVLAAVGHRDGYVNGVNQSRNGNVTVDDKMEASASRNGAKGWWGDSVNVTDTESFLLAAEVLTDRTPFRSDLEMNVCVHVLDRPPARTPVQPKGAAQVTAASAFPNAGDPGQQHQQPSQLVLGQPQQQPPLLSGQQLNVQQERGEGQDLEWARQHQQQQGKDTEQEQQQSAQEPQQQAVAAAAARDGGVKAEGDGEEVVTVLPNVLGKGHFGCVLLGRYRGETVAVKVLHALVAADGGQACGLQQLQQQGQQHVRQPAVNSEQQEAALRTFAQEVEVLGRCQHPNVVRLLAACVTPPRLCLVMELCETSLAGLIFDVKRRRGGTLLPLETVVHIAVQVASALAYLHPTIVHRDLKPQNVLINSATEAFPVAKIADFGLSRLRLTAVPTETPEAGTHGYMAPECYDIDCNIITHQADIYSLGMLLWVMLTGQSPWKGHSVLVMAYKVAVLRQRPSLALLPPKRCPAPLMVLLLHCWEHDPRRRPAAAEVLKVLLQLQAELVAAAAGGGAAAATAAAADGAGMPKAPLPLQQQ